MSKKDESRDWKRAAEKCLTTALEAAETYLQDGQIEKLKVTESLIKTVGDVVGAGQYLGRMRSGGTAPDGGDDE